MVGYKVWLKISEKATNVQRKPLKDLQKACKTFAQDHFKGLQESLAPWKESLK